MSDPRPRRDNAADEADPILERLVRERLPGEIESGMMTGSDEADISATERFEGDLTPEEALQVLDPERHVLDTQPGG
jgi:hypothetical protein